MNTYILLEWIELIKKLFRSLPFILLAIPLFLRTCPGCPRDHFHVTPTPHFEKLWKKSHSLPHSIRHKKAQSKKDHKMTAKNTIQLPFKIGYHGDVI